MPKQEVDNTIYDQLGERWLTAQDDPVALLRAEAELRNAWVAQQIEARFDRARVLDVGCGAGFLTRHLEARHHTVVGIDAAPGAIAIARRGSAGEFVVGDARQLPFADGSFDVVCAMDVLEHIEPMETVVAECARALRPGGLLLTYTFNRTPLAWLLAVKGIEWCVRNTPKHLHVWRLFVKPRELAATGARCHLNFDGFVGVAPVIASRAFWRLVATGVVPTDFRFRYTRSLQVGYLARATKDAAKVGTTECG